MTVDDLLADYLQQRRAAGDDGRTLLVGLNGGMAVFALAAGLRGSDDHPRFLTFARYLLHARFRCDGFALLLPAMRGGEALYVVERQVAGESAVWLAGSGGDRRPSDIDGRLIGDLGLSEHHLPGVMRREFDRLYEALKRPLPVAAQG